jgi:type I restriction enzyme M protein
MDYWTESMQDDCYLIAADGWVDAAKPKLIIEDKSKKTKVKPDLLVGKKKYTTELIPPDLLIARYFVKDQAAIDALEADLSSLEQQLEEMAEEHGGEGGLLEEAKNDKDKLSKVSALNRLKEIKVAKSDLEDALTELANVFGKDVKSNDKAIAVPTDEEEALVNYLAIVEKESAVRIKIRTLNDELIAKVAAKYEQLTETDIKTLVVDDKWIALLATAVQGELDRVSQTLTGRIRELAERYESPLPHLVEEVAVLSAKVDDHLKKMGATWM